MDTITIILNEDKFKELIDSGALNFFEFEIKQKEPKDFDYSGFEEWKIAKKESVKSYKMLKKIEFDIRNNKHGEIT